MQKFKDSAIAPIIAFDFDGTLETGNAFTTIGQPRRYAKEVTHFLHSVGVIVAIWSCRDKKDVPDEFNDVWCYDDVAPMVDWLRDNDIYYDSINSTIEYSPFRYEARKVFAHMYVDDRGYGWQDTDQVLLMVTTNFLHRVIGVPHQIALFCTCSIAAHPHIPVDPMYIDLVKESIKEWRAKRNA